MKTLIIMTLAIVSVAHTAWAHHSLWAEFDPAKPVRLQGVVAKVDWVNPHVWISLKVRQDDGHVVAWRIEGDSPYALMMRGWRKALITAGIVVEVQGYLSRHAASTACGRLVTLPDGEMLVMAWFPDAPPSSRIHYRNDRIGEALDYGIERSPTLRALVATIDAADVIVSIVEGRCGRSAAPSCLQLMSAAGVRYLSVRIDPRQALEGVVRQLAHEFQHATEIAQAPGVTDRDTLRYLYAAIGFRSGFDRGADLRETARAQAAELDVLRELDRPEPIIDKAYFGRWALRPAESTFENVAPPASGTRWHRDRGHGLISVVSEVVDTAAHHLRRAFVYRPDGREYPIASAEGAASHTITETAIDRYTARFVLKQNGAVAVLGRRVLDRTAKVMTIESEGVDGEGRAWRSVERWQKEAPPSLAQVRDQALSRAAHDHLRRLGRLAQPLGDLVVRVPELESPDDDLSIEDAQARERFDESFGSLSENGFVFRRWRVTVRKGLGKFCRCAATLKAARQIPDAVHDGLPKVMLQAADRAMFERGHALERPQEGVLHEVLGVGGAAGVRGDAMMRPPPKRRQRALDEDAECGLVAFARTRQHVQR